MRTPASLTKGNEIGNPQSVIGDKVGEVLQAHVRLWHKADTLTALQDVCCLRESGH